MRTPRFLTALLGLVAVGPLTLRAATEPPSSVPVVFELRVPQAQRLAPPETVRVPVSYVPASCRQVLELLGVDDSITLRDDGNGTVTVTPQQIFSLRRLQKGAPPPSRIVVHQNGASGPSALVFSFSSAPREFLNRWGATEAIAKASFRLTDTVSPHFWSKIEVHCSPPASR
jgi:hypothetical protein